MTRAIFISALTLFAAASVLIVVCAAIVSGRGKDRQKERASNMSLCCKCKRGEESMMLDKGSEICPYIESYHNNECSAFVPLKKEKTKI